MKQIQLQGIGKRNAVEARELKENDIMLCNFGYEQTITNIRKSKTGKTILVDIIYNGVVFANRKYNCTRLVALKEVNA